MNTPETPNENNTQPIEPLPNEQPGEPLPLTPKTEPAEFVAGDSVPPYDANEPPLGPPPGDLYVEEPEDPKDNNNSKIIIAVVGFLIFALIFGYYLMDQKEEDTKEQNRQEQVQQQEESEERAEEAAKEAAEKRAQDSAQDAADAREAEERAEEKAKEAQQSAEREKDAAQREKEAAERKEEAAREDAKVSADEADAKSLLTKTYSDARDSETPDGQWPSTQGLITALQIEQPSQKFDAGEADSNSNAEVIYVDVSGQTLTLSYLTNSDSICSATGEAGSSAKTPTCESS